MTSETILTNATLILPTEVVAGTLVIRGGRIADVQPGRSHAPSATDLGGDHLMPGVVDVHTDNLERQVQPRLTARWPSRSAMLAHDAQCASAGVTTVLDALCLGDLGFSEARIKTFRDAMVDLDALTGTGLLKSEHYLHLRCELPATDMMDLVDPVADHPLVRMVSLMDHSPGVGQYADMDRYWKLRRESGFTDEQIQSRIDVLSEQRARMRTPNRRALLKRVAHLDIELASHDDRTEEEIAENIAASDLVRAGRVDAFASDYVPAALVESAWLCVAQTGVSLPEAVGYITDKPARMSRLPDRGRLEPGLRADLVHVRVHEGHPVVMQVWRGGERVA